MNFLLTVTSVDDMELKKRIALWYFVPKNWKVKK